MDTLGTLEALSQLMAEVAGSAALAIEKRRCTNRQLEKWLSSIEAAELLISELLKKGAPK